MRNQPWTFVCVSGDDGPVRQFSVSARALHYFPSLATAVITVLAALGMIVAIDGSARLEIGKLRGERAAISLEVESIRTRVGQMEGSIDRFIENDEQFRVIAGLSPIDAEIFEVGVGGPGMTAPVSDPIAPDPRPAGAGESAAWVPETWRPRSKRPRIYPLTPPGPLDRLPDSVRDLFSPS